MKLSDSIQFLKGVGPKSFENYQKLRISTLLDLLLYFPFRYEDITGREVLSLTDGEKATLVAEVATPAQVSYFGRHKNRLAFKARQGEVVFAVNFFNQPYLADKIVVGENLAFYGKWESKKQQLSGMKIFIDSDEEFQPVYHVMQGVKQAQLVKLIRQVIDMGGLDLLEENLPESLLAKYRLIGRQKAVLAMHFPTDMAEHEQALRRIKFEELFFFQMKLQALKNKERIGKKGTAVHLDERALTQKMSELPFDLTDSQKKVLKEILADMTSSYHMNRLLQGDVGSGKTIVAALAMYAAVLDNFQAALMVPTEILARQHYEGLQALFPQLKIELFIGGVKVSERKKILSNLTTGQAHMVVGTHALIQEGVEYYNLGLVVTDEQHRFGVNQRKLLREKGGNPDVLMMTATPIPRTLAITTFGDMDTSIIDELPKGRQAITTRWVRHEQMPDVLKWIKDEIQTGGQIYFVSPLIEESEALDLKNAEALHAELTDYFGKTVKIGLLHGRLKGAEKETIMSDFKSKKLDVLVSTTVVEVGVDVPNATVMVIMDADRFGLSQLHQLRGRVGRGAKKSYTVLVANPKTDSGRQRMLAMVKTQNGFVLAEEDLKMRGAGEIFGIRQSGIPEFAVADIIEDYNILEVARQEAQAVYEHPKRADNEKLISQAAVVDGFD